MRESTAYVFAFGIVVGFIIASGLMGWFGSRNVTDIESKWDRERDSLTTANNLLTIRLDSARAESIAHEQRAESLATVPRTIYITNATRLTSGAPLDSLGILFFAAPFVAVSDTLLDHHEP